jgi:hypothetical protein
MRSSPPEENDDHVETRLTSDIGRRLSSSQAQPTVITLAINQHDETARAAPARCDSSTPQYVLLDGSGGHARHLLASQLPHLLLEPLGEVWVKAYTDACAQSRNGSA